MPWSPRRSHRSTPCPACRAPRRARALTLSNAVVTSTRAAGPAETSCAGAAALKPASIRLRSGVELSWIAPTHSDGWCHQALGRHEAGGATRQRHHRAHRRPRQLGQCGRVALDPPARSSLAIEGNCDGILHAVVGVGCRAAQGQRQGSRRGRMVVSGSREGKTIGERPQPANPGTGRAGPAAYNSALPAGSARREKGAHKADRDMTQTMMKALVKREAARASGWKKFRAGTRPERGPGQAGKTAICGTDCTSPVGRVSQRTIKPGLVIGTNSSAGWSSSARRDRLQARPARFRRRHIVCGHCRNCRGGRQHLCPNTVGIGVNRHARFAEYIVMRPEPVGRSGPDPQRTGRLLLPSAMPRTARWSSMSWARTSDHRRRPDRHRCRGICKHIGARNVVVTDVNDYRLKLAADMGATRVATSQTSAQGRHERPAMEASTSAWR